MPSRRAFGLIELLVVLAILLILFAFLIPAVARVRATANRAHTENNLKQCALALHNYHSVYKQFPDAFNTAPNFAGNRTIWFQLLPYLEAQDVYNNDALDGNVIPAYVSPDDVYNVDPKGKLNLTANVRAFGYATYGADCDNPKVALKVMDPKTAIVGNIKIRNFLDGTSNTILLSTRMSSCDRTAKGEPVHTLASGDPGTPNGGFFGASQVSTPPSPYYAAPPIVMMHQLHPKDFDELPVGKSVKCINSASSIPHTLRPGDLLTAYCDGSVRSQAAKTEPRVFASALCPADEARDN
jgi:prepilin-type N-terminal cleavage/methylation domain-containing protein